MELSISKTQKQIDRLSSEDVESREAKHAK